MTEQAKQKQVFTYVVQLPPNTDVHEMLGAYKNLFSIQGVDITLMNMIPTNTQGFSHPIPECQQILQTDFFRTMESIQAAVTDHTSVYLENFTVNGKTVVFTFYYLE